MAEIQLKHTADEIDKAVDRSVENENAIAVLNGTRTGSVSKTVADEVAKIVAEAPEDFDTLKEMSDWLTAHESTATEMNSKILANTSAIEKNTADIAKNATTLTAHEKTLTTHEESITQNTADIATVTEQAVINQQTVGYQRKNLLKNTATTQTKNGITFTVMEDGSVTASGTATANATLTLNTNVTLPATGLAFTGNPEGASNSTYRLNLMTISYGSDTTAGIDSDTIFTPSEDVLYLYRIIVYSGVTVDNLVFKPMLRDARITDSTYEAYKPSIEERLSALEALMATSTSATESEV